MQENEEVIRVLESIGLNKNEIIIYLDLIEVGESSAGDISKRTKIHRSNVYDTIKKLIEKGIVRELIKDNRRVFFPIAPKDILNYFKQKEYDLQKIIPEIEKIHSKPEEKNKVMVFEGIQAIRAAIDGLLELNKPIFTYGIPKEVLDILGGFIHDFHKRRIAKKIPIRHIYNRDASKRIKEQKQMKYTEARYLPYLYDTKIDTTICGNKVILWMWEPPFTVITIENEPIAKTYQSYFEILWRKAKESV